MFEFIQNSENFALNFSPVEIKYLMIRRIMNRFLTIMDGPEECETIGLGSLDFG